MFACCLMLAGSLAWGQDRLRIGSKRFTEAYILAQVLAQTASPHTAVEVLPGLGNTAIVYAALRAGSIDLYPEYTGTIARVILKDSQVTTLQAMRGRLAPLGLGVDISLGFWNKLFGPDLLRLTLQHLALVLSAVGLAVFVGVPLAVVVAPYAGPRAFVLGICGVLQTVPSLALLAVLISWIDRIGSVPALIALTLYALLPIMRNTCTGLAEVPAGLTLAGALPAATLALLFEGAFGLFEMIRRRRQGN